MVFRPRILIATPYSAERAMLADWLTADGFEPVNVLSVQSAVTAIQAGDFDILLADAEFAFRDGLHALKRAGRHRQSTLMIGPADAAIEARAQGVGAIYLTRPVDRASLVCLASMVIVEDRPMRRSPRKTVRCLDALVEGVPSQVVDLSREGLRLEVPRTCPGLTVPYFRVRVPMIGTDLTVRRVWTGIRPGASRSGLALCGGTLAKNPPRAEQAWHMLVDALPAATRPAPAPRRPAP